MARWRLREIAEPLGWNPHSLAIEAKLAYNTVRPIWIGDAKRADLETLHKLAQVLNVPPGRLIGNGEDEMIDEKNSLPTLLAVA
jgi:transcriptional regulator with XRE-family HTH domain